MGPTCPVASRQPPELQKQKGIAVCFSAQASMQSARNKAEDACLLLKEAQQRPMVR
jgi:hypothetical protein